MSVTLQSVKAFAACGTLEGIIAIIPGSYIVALPAIVKL